jgi:hypothetical protein
MKSVMVSVVVATLLCAGMAEAGSIGTEYSSKFMWRGYKLFDEGMVRTFTNMDVGPLEFGAAFHLPDQSGDQENQRLDGSLSYAGDLGDLAYVLGYGYYSFPEQSTHDSDHSSDFQEIFATVSLPGDITPYYTIAQMWSSNAGDQINPAQGALHIFGLEVELEPVTLSGELVYNDGVKFQGQADHDWSHAILGAAFDVPVGQTAVFRPAAFYQIACDDSVLDKDESWFSLSLIYPF